MMKHIIQTKCPLFDFMVLVCAVTLLTGCDLQSYSSPEGYDLDKPQKMQLGKSLNEISGINYNSDDTSLLAISDSKKKVFQLNFLNPKLKDYTEDVVGANSDLEDLVKVDSFVYLLSSKGVIYEVPIKAKDTAGVGAYTLPSAGPNDFEAIYYDSTVNGLIMLCKTCAFDKGKQRRSAFKFDLATKQFDTAALYSISTIDVKQMIKNDEAKFDPSAAAINPISKRLYILSSAGNLLVITNNLGKPIETFQLNPDDHPQAEGIAFAPNGDMFISNEGKFGKPTLQVFPYHKKK